MPFVLLILSNLLRQKIRTGLTVLGISIGITTVVAREAEEGGYWTEVPGLPGAGSQGEPLAEAIENTKDSIRLVLGVMRDQGQQIAVPNDVVVNVTVAA